MIYRKHFRLNLTGRFIAGVCDDPTVVTEASDHGPCNAYIECVLGVPEKRCCDIGQSYSRTYQRCVTDPKCRDTCVAPPKSNKSNDTLINTNINVLILSTIVSTES